MYETFKSYRDIDEDVIPSNREIRGRRYGFVIFFEVRDEDMLTTKLDNIFIGTEKFFVNIPRF